MMRLRSFGAGLATLAVGLLTALPALAAEQPPEVNAGSLLRLIFGLAVVVGLIVGLSVLLRRLNGLQARGGSQMRVLSAVSLGNREKAVLMQVGDKQLLVGVAPGRVQTLHVFDEPVVDEPPRGGEGGQSPFADKLHQLMRRQPDEKR